MEPKKKEQLLYSIRYSLPRDQIMTFVSGLHDIQAEMIEEVLALKEAEGFPEATDIINHIKSL